MRVVTCRTPRVNVSSTPVCRLRARLTRPADRRSRSDRHLPAQPSGGCALRAGARRRDQGESAAATTRASLIAASCPDITIFGHSPPTGCGFDIGPLRCPGLTRGDVYRFLLRMPEELRIRLAGSAEESGRSLNREIVHRLEDSFERSECRRRARGEERASCLGGTAGPRLPWDSSPPPPFCWRSWPESPTRRCTGRRRPSSSGDPDRGGLKSLRGARQRQPRRLARP